MIRSDSSEGPKSGSTGSPIYHDLSPRKVLLTRALGACALFMVVLAFIFCLARGVNVNKNFFLLACNVIITGFVGAVNAWWYRKGDLEVDKYWYVMVVSGVIMFQCLIIDIFVFHVLPSPTPAPPTTTPFHNQTTHNLTTHKPPEDYFMTTAAL